MKKFLLTSAITLLLAITAIGCGKKEETYDEYLQRSFEEAVKNDLEKDYYKDVPTIEDKEELEKIKNDRILAGKILESYLGRIMDPDVLFSDDYDASREFLNAFKENGGNLIEMDATSSTAAKKMAEELGVKSFDELLGKIQSENACDSIMIILNANSCTVILSKTDATGNKDAESTYPIVAIGNDSTVHKEQRKREGLE